MSSMAIMLAWLNKTSNTDVTMKDLKNEAKKMGLNLLRSKDKNTHIKAIASTLLRNEKVSIGSVELHKVCRDDVQLSST